MKSNPIIGKSIYLRALNQNDCSDRYLNWMKNNEITKYLESRWLLQNKNTLKAFVKETNNSNHSIIFGIFLIKNSEHIGNIKIGPINRYHSYADIGYIIGEQSAWNKGYSTEAVNLIVKYAFDDLGLNKCTAGVYSTNIASSKVLEKSGFVKEGCFKKHLKNQNVWDDHIAYGIINSKYKQ
jgi:[ribosomal protein S5]-alanine N-acetyltransferase